MAEIVHNIGDMREMLNRHDQDLYRGNGKPGITTRLAVMEDSIAKYGSDILWVKGLLISVLLTAIVDVIIHATGHGK